jgi:perosamine synthetase
MDLINDIALKNNLFVIEDAAEAIFSKFNGKFAGTLSDIGSFSFQATKTITTGEGGMCLTGNEGLKEKMKLIRNHGMRDKKYWHEGDAFNFRLTNLQAAIGVGQLEHQTEIVSIREKIYSYYLKNLKGLTLQKFKSSVEPVVWGLAVKLSEFQNRDLKIANLKAQGIETRPGFSSFFQMKRYNCPLLPVSEKLSQNIILLPFYLDLTEGDIELICRELMSNNF